MPRWKKTKLLYFPDSWCSGGKWPQPPIHISTSSWTSLTLKRFLAEPAFRHATKRTWLAKKCPLIFTKTSSFSSGVWSRGTMTSALVRFWSSFTWDENNKNNLCQCQHVNRRLIMRCKKTGMKNKKPLLLFLLYLQLEWTVKLLITTEMQKICPSNFCSWPGILHSWENCKMSF